MKNSLPEDLTFIRKHRLRSNSVHQLDSIVLISESHELAEGLSSVINRVINHVDQLPQNTGIKAIIVDTSCTNSVKFELATQPTTFLAIYHPLASESPLFRSHWFDLGVNMVAHDHLSLLHTLEEAVIPAGDQGGDYICPYCSLDNLSEKDMYYHCPAFHINWPNEKFVTTQCPICRVNLNEPLQVHIHENHGPRTRELYLGNNPALYNKVFNQLYNFSLVICRHPITGKFLLCQEFANQGYWCPGGAVDPGETLTQAAKRETLEEAGIEIELKGILALEYNPVGVYRKNDNHYLIRMRVIFYAEPSVKVGMQQLPKSSPDFESVGACWCSYEEIQSQIKLRGNEPKKWSKYLIEGGLIYPLSFLIEKSG